MNRDVYTSYDYSACIREFGMLSSRGRNVRKSILFARSFDPYFTKTELVTQPKIQTSIPHTLNLQRQAVQADQAVTFTFFRNFDRKKRETFDVTIELDDNSIVTLGCHIPYKSSFVALGNYVTQNDLHLILSTIPILSRVINKDRHEEVWIVEPNMVGGMVFKNKQIKLSGNMQDNVLRADGPTFILSFEKSHGWTRLETTDGSLYIIGLDKYDAGTLYAEFIEPYWNNGQKNYPSFVAWGADEFFYNKKTRQVEIKHRTSERSAHFISFDPVEDNRLSAGSALYDLPFVRSLIFEHHQNPLPVSIRFDHWEVRQVDFEQLPWSPVQQLKGKPVYDSLDYHYTSGHVLYRKKIKATHKKVKLSVNARHRATVLLNNRIIGGHTTYSRQLFLPGAKIGPDPWFLGSRTYDITPYLTDDENELVIIVESFGLNRQAFIMNDIRNPRGIIQAKLSGINSTEQGEWEISGVDVRLLTNAYSTTGFPDEATQKGWQKFKQFDENDGIYKIPISVTQGVQWFRFRFDHALKKQSDLYRIPLRLHLDGEWTAVVILNDVIIARYYGNGDGPQHDFYIPDGLLKAKHNEVKVLAYTWHDTLGEISIKGWPVLEDSGNLITHYDTNTRPQEYIVYSDRILMHKQK